MTVTREIATRWMDNDEYGHVNNTVYFSYFDTAINGWLIEATGVDIRKLPAIGIVAEVSCRYLKEIRFPETVSVTIDIEKLGNSSIVYDLKIDTNGGLAADRSVRPCVRRPRHPAAGADPGRCTGRGEQVD